MVQYHQIGVLIQIVLLLMYDYHVPPGKILYVLAEHLGSQGSPQQQQGIRLCYLLRGLSHVLAVHHLSNQGNHGPYGNITVPADWHPLRPRHISDGILFLTSGALVLVNTSVKIYNMTAAAPAGLVIDVAVYDALELSGPLHGSQGRAGSSVPWRVVKHLLFVELEKLLRTGIIKCTGIHFLNTVAIPVLNVIGLILLLNTDETALFHHTGTTESHSIGTIIQNLS